ncbi:MAG: hypothetical protein C4296_02960 [Gemmataceae bacterium]
MLGLAGPVQVRILSLLQDMESGFRFFQRGSRQPAFNDLAQLVPDLSAIEVEARGQMRVVGVAFLFLPRVRVGLGCYQPNRRIIDPLLITVIVGFDWATLWIGCCPLRHVHPSLEQPSQDAPGCPTGRPAHDALPNLSAAYRVPPATADAEKAPSP